MRLLTRDGDGKLSFAKILGDSEDQVPPYAILSHTWLPDDNDEVRFEDIENRWPYFTNKLGYAKIALTMDLANKDKFQYCWVDSCCINKADPDETAAAIRSMYRWYRDSAKCYVYLADVADESEIRGSRWFSRGWTLQELLAPRVVKFYSNKGILLGNKEDLSQLIQDITRIPKEAICGKPPLNKFSVPQKLKWRAGRETKKREDQAYCLLGIFDVDIDIVPGGEHTAFARLLDAIHRKDDASENLRGGRRLTYDPSVWPFAESMLFRELVTEERQGAAHPQLKQTQDELRKNIKLATYIATNYDYALATELLRLTLADAESDAAQLRGQTHAANPEMASYINFIQRRLGNMYYHQRNFAAAKDMFTKALYREDGGEIEQRVIHETQSNLGNSYAEIGQMEEAKHFTELAVQGREKAARANLKEIDARRELVRSRNNRAAGYEDQGRLGEAEAEFQQAMDIVKRTPERWMLGLEETELFNNLGRLYLKKSESKTGDQGSASLRKAIEAFNNAKKAWVNKAKRGSKVKSDFKLTPQEDANPAYLNAIEGLGKVHSRLGEDIKANECFKKAFEGRISGRQIQICGTAQSWATFAVNRGFFRFGLERIDEAKAELAKHYPSRRRERDELEAFGNEIRRLMMKETWLSKIAHSLLIFRRLGRR